MIREKEITLKVKYDDDVYDPEDWDWSELLDVFREDVEVVGVNLTARLRHVREIAAHWAERNEDARIIVADIDEVL